ncbi:hypothetical protein K457DRAFT_271114 [Linnemannia elongata AG-77]|uniref:Uncharacterized protein n=1 Tax=Linnemannia elongata AG-77 TaxID=1314771 RepID=A0A197K8T0_9FUNG|nr:hypothetical protein K457DRAFT_271114 [Linnemannia elongata AG-77]
MKADNNSPPPILPQMNSPITIHAPTGSTNLTRAETPIPSSPPTSSSNTLLPTGQSEPSSLSSDNMSDNNNISCKHEPSSSNTIDDISNINNNKHEADTSNTPAVDVAAAHLHPNSSDPAQDTAATATLAQPIRAESDIVPRSNQQHELLTDISEHAPENVAVLACDDSASPTTSSPSDCATVEAVTEHSLHVLIEPNHNQQQQPSSLTSSTTTTSTTTTWITNEEEGESEKGQGIGTERTFSQTSRSIFDEPTTTTTASKIDSKPLPTMAMPVPIPSNNSRLSPLHVHSHVSTMTDSSSFVSSSSASPLSSSSSSLSDYLIIGQEQVERDDSECDQRSERSYASSRDSYGERYAEDLMYDDASQDSQSESHSPAPSSPPSSSPSHRDTPRRRTSRPSRRSSRPFDKEEDDEGERPDFSRTFSDGYAFEQQQRITESTTRSSVRIEDEEEEIPMPSSRPQSRSSTNKTYKRRSHKTTDDSRAAPSVASPVAAAPAAAMPVFKLPTIRGMTKSIVELMVASVVCISLISCMFAFSYISTGANHALGWYSDQQIGQRIRDSLKKREHVLQETLEKMAGEEYVKVKRQSQQYRQHHQQQQQQQARPGSPSPPYGPGGSSYYQNRYQQQYQQQREQRQQQQQQQQQQQKAYQDDPDRGRLSTAEWQELIRAASVSFMAKWTTATPNPWTSRR